MASIEAGGKYKMLRYSLSLSILVLSLIIPVGAATVVKKASVDLENSCCPLPPPPQNPPVTSLYN